MAWRLPVRCHTHCGGHKQQDENANASRIECARVMHRPASGSMRKGNGKLKSGFQIVASGSDQPASQVSVGSGGCGCGGAMQIQDLLRYRDFMPLRGSCQFLDTVAVAVTGAPVAVDVGGLGPQQQFHM